MTRDFVFTLTDTTKNYNLWDDLIAPTIASPTIASPTFANSPYVPSNVQQFEIQNQTPGATVLRNGFSLTGGSWDVQRASVNSISIKSTIINTDTNPTVIYVSISAN